MNIWLPYPQSDDYQEILEANVTSPYPTKISTGAEYVNAIVHIKLKNPTETTVRITMEFTVLRSEHVHNNFTQGLASSNIVPPADVERWLQPDHSSSSISTFGSLRPKRMRRRRLISARLSLFTTTFSRI